MYSICPQGMRWNLLTYSAVMLGICKLSVFSFPYSNLFFMHFETWLNCILRTCSLPPWHSLRVYRLLQSLHDNSLVTHSAYLFLWSTSIRWIYSRCPNQVQWILPEMERKEVSMFGLKNKVGIIATMSSILYALCGCWVDLMNRLVWALNDWYGCNERLFNEHLFIVIGCYNSQQQIRSQLKTNFF